MTSQPFKSRPTVNPFEELYRRTEVGKQRWSFFGGVGRLFVLMLIGLITGGVGAAVGGYFYFTDGLPSIEGLKNHSFPIVTQVYADKGELITEFAKEKRYVLPFERIPKMLQDAFVAAEDQNFWHHPGMDAAAIVRAAVTNFTKSKSLGGASTITQQVVKLLLLTTKKTYSRKIREIILSRRIEKSLTKEQIHTKEQILYLYLNHIYLGSRAHGVEAAARTYFDKSVKDLSIAECAMLAGLPQGPSRLSPKVNLKGALERRHYVLNRMLKDGYITKEQFDRADAEEPRIVSRTNPYANIAPDFVEHVRRYVEQKYGADAVLKEGLQVYATVNLDATQLARKSIEEGLRELDKRQGYRGPIKTLNVQGVRDFLEEKTLKMKEPPRFGEVVEGVVTHIDHDYVYVRMGTYVNGDVKKEYVGRIKIDPGPKWWVRTPFVRAELRTRNFVQGDLPFQVGDLILVRLEDPNTKRRELYLKKYGKTDPEMINYKVYTEEMVTSFPLEPEQEPVAQAALMLRDSRSGYVKAMVGGYNYSGSDFNRATQSRRQAGSSFKPAIYAAALNKGFTCADTIIDSPLAMTVPGTGEVWRPKNYRGGFAGPVTFRNALVKSRNIPTIKILQQIGLEQAKVYARRLGYTSPLVGNLTLALGSTGVSLEEQLNVFSVFPNKGYAVPNVFIKKIVDRNGKVLEEHNPPALLDDPVEPDRPQFQTVSHDASQPSDSQEGRFVVGTQTARKAVDEGTAYIMCTILQDVVREGTATVLKKIVGRPDIAGKTGTTNDCIDAWFMGFSPDYTCGVWVGFDDEFSLGEGETGGKAAAPIWGDFMKRILKDKPVKEFVAPATVEIRNVDPRTGLVTASGLGRPEIFKIGSGPAAAEPKLLRGSRWDYAGSDLDQF